MKLYSAKLYVVKDDIEYFHEKKFVKSDTPYGLNPTLYSNSVGDIEYFRQKNLVKENGISRSILNNKNVMTFFDCYNKTNSHDSLQPFINVFLPAGDYYEKHNGILSNLELRLLRRHGSWCYEFPYINEDRRLRCQQFLETRYYLNNPNLIVVRKHNHKLEDITTRFVFPELLCEYARGETTTIVFNPNQRIYARITDTISSTNAEAILNRTIEEELEKRKKAVTYLMQQAEQHWNPLPSISSKIKKQLEKINDNEQAEKKIKTLVKIVQQMRNDN